MESHMMGKSSHLRRSWSVYDFHHSENSHVNRKSSQTAGMYLGTPYTEGCSDYSWYYHQCSQQTPDQSQDHLEVPVQEVDINPFEPMPFNNVPVNTPMDLTLSYGPIGDPSSNMLSAMSPGGPLELTAITHGQSEIQLESDHTSCLLNLLPDECRMPCHFPIFWSGCHI